MSIASLIEFMRCGQNYPSVLKSAAAMSADYWQIAFAQ